MGLHAVGTTKFHDLSELHNDVYRPDVIKPFATTVLHDLLVLGHRIGLNWTEVRPLEGKLVAQGVHGDYMVSMQVPGLGLMVTFQHDSERKFDPSTLRVPNVYADMLAFGIIPGDTRLGFDNVLVANQKDCEEYAMSLDIGPKFEKYNARKSWDYSVRENARGETGMEHVMPLISPCLLLKGCRIRHVQTPNSGNWCTNGSIETMETYVVFQNELKEISSSADPQAHRKIADWILSQWNDHEEEFQNKPFVWSAFSSQVDALKLANSTSALHKRCTEKMLEEIKGIREELEPFEGSIFAHKPPDARATKMIMQVLLRFHLLRAFGLRQTYLDPHKTNRATISVPESVSKFGEQAKMHCFSKHRSQMFIQFDSKTRRSDDYTISGARSLGQGCGQSADRTSRKRAERS